MKGFANHASKEYEFSHFLQGILESFHPHIRSGKVLHQTGRKICDPHHHFAAIQGTDCVTVCLVFYTLWEGVCTYIFSFSDCVCISEYFRSNKNSGNAPTSSDDEIQGVSHILSCIFYTLTHDHGVRNLFIEVFHQKQFIQLIQVGLNIF